MRSPTKQGGGHRQSGEHREEPVQTVGDRPVPEQRGVVTSMVDALEDILKWERASERAMRIASETKNEGDASAN